MVPAQFAGGHALRRVDGDLAGHRYHRAAGNVVILVGGFVPGQRVVPLQSLHRLEDEGELGAATLHRADIDEAGDAFRSRADFDAGAGIEREQAVVEGDVVGGDGGLIVLTKGAEASFESARFFRLQPGAGGEGLRRDLQRTTATTADKRSDVLRIGRKHLVVAVELETNAGLRQHRFLGGQRAGGIARLGAGLGVGTHARVGALDADVDSQTIIHETHAVLHIELACADVEVLVEQTPIRIDEVGVVQERAIDVVEIALDVMIVLLPPQAGFQLVDAERPGQRGGQALTIDGVVAAADGDRQHLVGAGM
ncbi:hypothetical protein D3C81_1108710 [compost metagenome]